MTNRHSLILAVCCCCLQFINGLNQATHTALRQQGNVTCERHDLEFTLIFDLSLNGDELGNIYLMNSTDSFDNTASSYSSQNGDIQGNGTITDPFTVNITATKTADGFNFTTGDDDLKKGYVIDGDSIGLVVMVKSVYNAPFFDKVHFPADVIYRASCNYSESHDLIVTSGLLTTSGENNENTDVVSEQAVLRVLDANTRTVATSVKLGDSILLQLQVVTPSFAVGIYGRSCSFCDNEFCNGKFAMQFIKPNGCSVLSRVSSFKHTAEGIAETEAFRAFVFNGDPNLFVQCRAHLCYKAGEAKCTDFCKFNSRKRRQVTFVDQSEEVVLSVGLTVLLPKTDTGNRSTIVVNLDDPFGIGSAATNQRKAEAEKAKAAQSTNNALVASLGVLAFGGLLFLGVGVGCYLKHQRNGKS